MGFKSEVIFQTLQDTWQLSCESGELYTFESQSSCTKLQLLREPEGLLTQVNALQIAYMIDNLSTH